MEITIKNKDSEIAISIDLHNIDLTQGIYEERFIHIITATVRESVIAHNAITNKTQLNVPKSNDESKISDNQ